MIVGKWQKPNSDDAGMGYILKKEVLRDNTHGTFDVKRYNEDIVDVIVHSYREVGTSLLACVEVVFINGHRRLGNVMLG